jgi:hypothetical protein
MLRAMRVPKPTPDCRLERLDHEVLLYCPATASTLFLNETAALVWDLCDGTRTVDEILDLLRGAYPESADSLPADVERALGHFSESGAMRLE